MLFVLIILIFIILITGLITGNFLFNLALNPKSSKSVIFHNEFDEEKELRRIEDENWLKENSKDVYLEKHKINLHAYEVQNKKESKIWIIAVHGYTDSASFMVNASKKFLNYGYNVLMPELRAHGKSEGKYIGMGWLDRMDLQLWIDYLIATYGNIKIILYGISMGAATVMMTSGEKLPSNVRMIIEDCGYTSVWEEFAHELKYLFHMPTFPALYNANLITKIRAGYSLKKASAIKQIKKSKLPILFIHGDKDNFVPFYMLEKLYNTATCPKEKLVIENAGHAEAQWIEPEKYWHTVRKFIKRYLF